MTAASGPNHGVFYQVLVAAPAEASAPGTGASVVASLDQLWSRCGDLFLVVCLQGWFSGPLGDSGGYLPFFITKNVNHKQKKRKKKSHNEPKSLHAHHVESTIIKLCSF